MSELNQDIDQNQEMDPRDPMRPVTDIEMAELMDALYPEIFAGWGDAGEEGAKKRAEVTEWLSERFDCLALKDFVTRLLRFTAITNTSAGPTQFFGEVRREESGNKAVKIIIQRRPHPSTEQLVPGNWQSVVDQSKPDGVIH